MDQVKIGKFIAGCRKQNNLTQMQLAEKLGITGIQFQSQQQAKRRLLELGVVSGS